MLDTGGGPKPGRARTLQLSPRPEVEEQMLEMDSAQHALSPLAAWTRSTVSQSMSSSGVPWIKYDAIEFGEHVGSGGFGVVYRAKYHGDCLAKAIALGVSCAALSFRIAHALTAYIATHSRRRRLVILAPPFALCVTMTFLHCWVCRTLMSRN